MNTGLLWLLAMTPKRNFLVVEVEGAPALGASVLGASALGATGAGIAGAGAAAFGAGVALGAGAFCSQPASDAAASAHPRLKAIPPVIIRRIKFRMSIVSVKGGPLGALARTPEF
jgi:hypothetical protein